MNRRKLLLSTLILFLLLGGCRPDTVSHPNISNSPTVYKNIPVYGGVLTVCDMRMVDVLGYPAEMTSGSPIRHSAPALETLFQLDAQGNILPKLALSYESLVPQRQLILHLREKILFHDGTPFNAQAVKWNLEQQIAASATGVSHIIGFQIVDEYTLKILLSQWDNTLLVSLCQAQGLMISPTAFQENGGRDWAVGHPVGTGPFRFLDRTPDGTITYTRNEAYWQSGKPYLDSIVIVFDSDPSSREYKLRTGVYNALIRGDINSLAGFSAEGYNIASIPSTGPWGMVFDSANPDSPFSDLRVRQAVCHAINKEYLVHNIYLDTVTETNQYATPGMSSYNPEVVGYPYDPTRAKQLLREAGYGNGFSTTFHYDESADNVDTLAHALKEMLAQVGISLELNPVSNGESNRMLLYGGGWTGIMGTFGSAQYDTLTQLYNYMVGSGKYSSMTKPVALTDNIHRALVSYKEDAVGYVLDIQELLVDESCLCCYFFANADYTVLSKHTHDTGFSSIMPVTMWMPADAWLDKEGG